MEYTFGIDLGGTSIRIGLYDHQMKLVGTRGFPTAPEAGPNTAVRAMAECITALRVEYRLKEAWPVGLGSPGPIDLRNGILGILPNLPGWDHFPLRDELQEAARVEVVLESDANAAAIAEWKLGAGRDHGLDSMAMITLGTGVGSGFVLHGRIWHGMFGMGGELGHATIFPGGQLCSCGSRGCLEMYTSAGAVVRSMNEVIRREVAGDHLSSRCPDTAHEIAALAFIGNPYAVEAYCSVGRALGIGIANLTSILDLPLIVVGGGVAEAWELFAPAMFKAVEANSIVYRLNRPKRQNIYERDRTHIVRATLGPAAGLLGAALLPRLATPQSMLARTESMQLPPFALHEYIGQLTESSNQT